MLLKAVMVIVVVGIVCQIPAPGMAREMEKLAPSAGKAKTKAILKTSKPDLVVSNINFSPGAPVEKDEITLWVFVKNVGRAQAGASTVRVKVGGESNPPVVPVPALAPGKEFKYTRKVTFNRAGNYLVTITADDGNAVAESREGNNVDKKMIRVKPVAKPDMVISKINFSPGSPTVADEITLWVFMKNIGQGPAANSGLQVKVGGESNPPVIPAPALEPNQEWRYTRKITLNKTGNYIVTAKADAGNVLTETNEGNNIKKATIKVKPAPKPDLIISKINFTPGSPKQHEQVRVYIFVKNIGPGKSSSCKVSKTNSMNNYSIWGDKQVPALDPGQEWRWDAYFQSNMAGTYYIRAVVDKAGQIDETDENNNSLDKKIVVGPPAN